MKAILLTILFAILGLLLSIGLFYLAGSIWGPLYQGEDEATRNFKIFLLVSLGFIVVGGFAGYRVANKA